MPAGRLSVRHVTEYNYEKPVRASYNEIRVTPRSGSRQVVLDARVEVIPGGSLRQYVDYFGSVVHGLELHTPHDALQIVGTAVVESRWQLLRPHRPLDWAGLEHPAVRDRFVEYLTPTAFTTADEALVEEGETLRAATTAGDAPEAVSAWVRDRLTYQSGVTGVHTTGLDAWSSGQGVCQDFAHLSLALLRSMGVPARYVSGYLHPRADATVGEVVVGQSHAWVQAWTGEWVDIDPTNGRPVQADHVLVATARDYSDVPPVRGVFEGGGSSTLSVTVEMTRLV